MAGRGRAPKETLSRERDQTRRAAQLTVIKSDGAMHGPDLPETFGWPAETQTWWLTWRRSAQAQTFTDTDWSFLLDTAVLHAEFWLGDRSVAAELRLRSAKFGATPEDRARLKLEIGDPSTRPAATSPQKRAQRARRERLLRSVDAGGQDAGEEVAEA